MHFVSSKMVVPKVLFLLTKKVFRKIFPFKRVIMYKYLYPYGTPILKTYPKLKIEMPILERRVELS